jgi:hypothetical protein
VNGVANRLWRVDAAVRNRRFATRLRQDALAPVVVLSPHLDDAVLSAWSVLMTDADVRVVNVFTGAPPAGSVAQWDRLAGATDSAEFMCGRVEEDRKALTMAGREPVNLHLLDSQYRDSRRPPSFRELDDALVAALPAASHIYAPAVLGGRHSDHELVRNWAVALQGHDVTLYAELPYAAEYGWPSWVTGEDVDPRLDPDVFWQMTPNRVLPAGERDGAHVERLRPADAASKLEAMRAYVTQWPMLDRGPVGLLSNPRIHGFEVFWRVR